MYSENVRNELRKFADDQPIISSHSHRTPWQALNTNCDLFKAFALHSGSTLVSAGMQEENWEKLKDMSLSPSEKWGLMRPYWQKIVYTGYGRAFLMATNRIFGTNKLDDSNVMELNDKFIRAYSDAESYYKRVLTDMANVRYTIWDYGTLDTPEGYFPAYRFENRRTPVWDSFFTVRTREDLESIEKAHNCEILNFDDYIDTFDRVFKEKLDNGMVALKILLGYLRTLEFKDVTHDEAEKVFNKIYTRIMPNPGYFAYQFDGPDYAEWQVLQDYMVHRAFYLSSKYNLPVQIHAGFQLGKRTIEEFGDPKLLNKVFIRYKNVRFIIMHTSIPYSYDLGVLAKNHSNVYVDFSWSNALSPSMAKRFFNDSIELVPIDRILAFGDDSATVEGTLGEALNSRMMVVDVLSQKVENQYLSVEEAKKIISLVLYENAKDLFLKGKV